MKFFKFNLPSISISRPVIFIIAVLISFGMWYMIVHNDMTDFEVDVILNYRGLSNKLFVTNGLVYHVKERIRGPKMLKNTLPEIIELPIDISGLKVGDAEPSNVFSVIDEQKKLMSPSVSRAFKTLYVEPAVIKLTAEYLDHIKMPVRIDFISDNQIFIRSISHQSISFHGPESEIKKLDRINIFPLNVTVDFLDVNKKSVVKDIPILIPKELNCPHVSAEPSSIKIEYVVKGERVNMVRVYPVTLSVADPSIYRVSPEIVQLSIKVPANKQKDEAYLNELRVTALPPDLKLGESRNVELNFTPPDGMEVANEHLRVTITRVSPNDTKNITPVLPIVSPQPIEKKSVETPAPRRRHRRVTDDESSNSQREQAVDKKDSPRRRILQRKTNLVPRKQPPSPSKPKPKPQASTTGKPAVRSKSPANLPRKNQTSNIKRPIPQNKKTPKKN